ncbi:MAG: endonuclease/exonuclease/phosphatase family protein [Bacteroidetes bacterium]|nr:endonuclease/exonuclease/phosphatase family protein [Bacteroidota bacterium]
MHPEIIYRIMKKWFLAFFVAASVLAYGQKANSYNEIASVSRLELARVIFYNVENLFDTINDPTIKDEDFLPESANKWDTKKYMRKQRSIAKVLSALCDSVQPLVIGLCEVENRNVLEDLIAQPALKKFKFGIAHINSEDERGIDAAFLYSKNLVSELATEKLTVNLGSDKTRDIVCFKGKVREEWPIWFFVNHWPSRREGEKESEDKRMIASNALRSKIEDVLAEEPTARILIMGDFNDNPNDKSLLNLTARKVKAQEPQSLVNLTKPLYESGAYTLKHQGSNHVFDQMIVSGNVLGKKNKCYISQDGAQIFNAQWLLYNHAKFGLIPNRTYASGKYVGGYSDHLPVYFDIVFK